MRLLICVIYLVVLNAEARLFSRVVGVVNDRYVTSREVQLSYLLERALTESSKKFATGTHSLDVGSKSFQRELNGVFLESVVELEAESFSIAKVNEQEVTNALKLVSEALKKLAIWPKIQPSAKELRSVLKRKLRAKSFIRFKAESSVVAISETEAKEYYQKNEARFGGLPYETFSARIKNFLKRQKMDERLQRWFDVLQRKYNVRKFIAIQNEDA